MSEPIENYRDPYAPPATAWQPPVVHQSAAIMPVTVPQRLVPPGARLGAVCLDLLLVLVTFGIGWWIWSFVTWSNGQSPAKSLLGHVVADPQTGLPFDWGRMFLREFVIRGLLFGILTPLTFGVLALADCFMVFDATRRTLHDRLAGSVVRYL